MDEFDIGARGDIAAGDGPLQRIVERRELLFGEMFADGLGQLCVVAHEGCEFRGDPGQRVGHVRRDGVHHGEQITAQLPGVGYRCIACGVRGVQGRADKLGLVRPPAVDGGLAGAGPRGHRIDRQRLISPFHQQLGCRGQHGLLTFHTSNHDRRVRNGFVLFNPISWSAGQNCNTFQFCGLDRLGWPRASSIFATRDRRVVRHRRRRCHSPDRRQVHSVRHFRVPAAREQLP